MPRAKCELAQILLSRFFMACKSPGPRAKWTLHDFCTGDKNRCANTVFCSRLCSRASKPGQACVIKSTSRNQSLLITCTLLTPRRRRRRLAPLLALVKNNALVRGFDCSEQRRAPIAVRTVHKAAVSAQDPGSASSVSRLASRDESVSRSC